MRCCLLLWCGFLFFSCSSSGKLSDKSVYNYDSVVSAVSNSENSVVDSDNSFRVSADSAFSNRFEYHYVFDTDKLDENGKAPVKEMSLIFFNSGFIKNDNFFVDRFRIGNYSSSLNSSVNEKMKNENNIKVSKSRINTFSWKVIFFVCVFILLLLLFRKPIFNAFVKLLFKFNL